MVSKKYSEDKQRKEQQNTNKNFVFVFIKFSLLCVAKYINEENNQQQTNINSN